MYLGRNHVAVPISGIKGRINSGSLTSSRPNINFIQGANVTLSINDDAGDDEIEITINSSLPSHSHSGSQVGLSNNVSNGTTFSSTSGTIGVINQGNVKLGFCFSTGGQNGTAQEFVGFGATKGTGSDQGHVTAYNLNTGFTLLVTNGRLWDGGGYNGSTTAFSGNTWNIAYNQPASRITGIYATAIGWS